MTAPTAPVAPELLTQPSVHASGWGHRHPGRKAWAVRGVSFEINPGEKVLIAGNSGAGKSTLLHGIAGVLDVDEGEVEGTLTVGGVPASSPRVRGRVGMVQQDPESQRVMGRIGDEVAFGLENQAVPRSEIWGRVIDSLRAVGLHYPLSHPTAELSGGEKQRLALACAIAMRPQVILLDEPTANLDPTGATEVREVISSLAETTGATLILVEHNLAPWVDRIDRLIVLTEGRVVAEGKPRDVIDEHRSCLQEAGVWIPGVDPLENLRVGEETGSSTVSPEILGARPNQDHSATPSKTSAEAELLLTRALSVGYSPDHALRSGINLRFNSATSTCIVGPNGAGKTTLALTLAGLLRPVSGTVLATDCLRGSVSSDEVTEWSAPELLGRLSMVFQEPQYQFVTSSVREELLLGPRLAGMEEGEAERLVEHYLDRLRLRHLQKAHPLSLSGGERRRLGVGTALIARPAVVVLDEPTFGQDFNTWREVVQLLVEAIAQGITLISVTHDMNLVRALGQEVVVLDELSGPAGEPSAEPRGESGGPRGSSSAPTSLSNRRKSPLSRVNPATQILGLFLMTLPLMLTIDPVSAGVAWFLELLLLPLTGVRFRQLLLRMSPLLVAAPLAAVSMLLYAAPGGEVLASWGPVIVSENSVTMALSIALRVLAVGTPAVVLLPSLGSTEVADSLTQIGHLPSRFVLSSLAAIRMVGLMLSDWEALHRARRSRGLKRSNFARSAFSLVAFALRRAESLSVSMEARGFGSDLPRTNARVSTLSGADAVMLGVSLLVPVVALASSVIWGTFTLFGIQ